MTPDNDLTPAAIEAEMAKPVPVYELVPLPGVVYPNLQQWRPGGQMKATNLIMENFDKQDLARDLSTATAKVLPAGMVALAPASGISLQDWVFILTIVYLLAQISFLMWKWLREFMRARRLSKALADE